MTEREALKQLLEALDKELPHNMKHIAAGQRFNARTALAQPEQEPVGEVSKAEFGDYPVICWRKGYVAKIGDKFYTTPPQRTWVGLSKEDKEKISSTTGWHSAMLLTEEILKEKNT